MIEKCIRGGICHAIHQNEGNKILELIQNPKSDKEPLLIRFLIVNRKDYS